VLTTLHTIDAAAAIARLVDMGVPPFLLASTLRLLVAQRLVRCICPHCKEERVHGIDDLLLEVRDTVKGDDRTPQGPRATRPRRSARSDPDRQAAGQPGPFYAGTGCPACQHTGTKGRAGIYEVMPVGQEVRELIQRNAPTHEIRTVAQNRGMSTLRDLGLLKALEGVATLEEILRITPR
jgi:type II secretory ATPase GspE/PulE/Tfp pilus assembly ATPase PilB-like protein